MPKPRTLADRLGTKSEPIEIDIEWEALDVDVPDDADEILVGDAFKELCRCTVPQTELAQHLGVPKYLLSYVANGTVRFTSRYAQQAWAYCMSQPPRRPADLMKWVNAYAPE